MSRKLEVRETNRFARAMETQAGQQEDRFLFCLEKLKMANRFLQNQVKLLGSTLENCTSKGNKTQKPSKGYVSTFDSTENVLDRKSVLRSLVEGKEKQIISLKKLTEKLKKENDRLSVDLRFAQSSEKIIILESERNEARKEVSKMKPENRDLRIEISAWT